MPEKLLTIQFHSQNDKIIELKNKLVVAGVTNRRGRGRRWVWNKKATREILGFGAALHLKTFSILNLMYT